MIVKVILCDINPRVVEAWRTTFEENPEVEIIHGSILDVPANAIVSPTNSKGSMDGGLDGEIKRIFGQQIERNLQTLIRARYGNFLPVGHATCIPTGRDQPAWLISTPTMNQSSEDISETYNVALACAAAFQAVHMQNAILPGSIRIVALPGLGAATGRVPVEVCADLMWTGYNLFREREFRTFEEMREALRAELDID